MGVHAVRPTNILVSSTQAQMQAWVAPHAAGCCVAMCPDRLISTLREYPTTEDFVYLKRMDLNPSVYDPYALDVMPFAMVDQKDFYTMSVRGITHYVDGITSDFASESRWWWRWGQQALEHRNIWAFKGAALISKQASVGAYIGGSGTSR